MHWNDSPDNPHPERGDAAFPVQDAAALDRRAERTRIADAITALAERHPEVVARDVSLRDLTTLRVGGPALGLCRITNVDDAPRFQEMLAGHRIPCAVLGGGSNVLVADRGYCGVVLRLENRTIEIEGETVRADAGAEFDALIRATLDAGLSGLEFASGIPGSIGGAVVGNAGCFGREICDCLESALLLAPDGRLIEVGPGDLAFAYRDSKLKASGDLLLQATFRLRRGGIKDAYAERERNLALRREKHPIDLPTAGSWFKNLPPESPGGRRRAAGQLLDEAGAHGLRCGDAGVFAKHANIIVNHGRASSRDVSDLAERMLALVQDRFDIELVEEVRRIG